MPRSAAEYLQHILDEVDYLESQVKATTKADFLQDETLKRSFARSKIQMILTRDTERRRD